VKTKGSGHTEPVSHLRHRIGSLVHDDCNMNTDERLKLSLEDVLADLWHARRTGDIGRLALLSYCDVRRWARIAHHQRLAARSHELVLSCPHSDREDFLFAIDQLIAEMEQAHAELAVAVRFPSPRIRIGST